MTKKNITSSIEKISLIYGGEEYRANKLPEGLEVSDRYGRRVVDIDLKTREYTWHLDHVCGAQGFGMDLSDRCTACQIPKMTSNSDESRKKLIANSRYTPDFEEALHHELTLPLVLSSS